MALHLTFHVLRLTPYISHLTFHVLRLTPHISHLTFHISRLTYLAEEVLLQDVTGVACADSDGQL